MYLYIHPTGGSYRGFHTRKLLRIPTGGVRQINGRYRIVFEEVRGRIWCTSNLLGVVNKKAHRVNNQVIHLFQNTHDPNTLIILQLKSRTNEIRVD